MSFKIKIKEDERIIVKAKAEHIEDFDPIFKDLKRKFRGNNG